jgi:O-antigen ligase
MLGLLWLLRAWIRSSPLPPVAMCGALAGLLALCALQLVPLGQELITRLSPRATAIRDGLQPGAAALAAERELLGAEPAAFDARPTLSLDPPATASALRTGAALAALFVVAHSVAHARGGQALALSLLLSAAFQGLYGLLVLASGHDRIWYAPNRFTLFSATGTFVNPNHFACYLAMALPCGAAAIVARLRPRAAGSASDAQSRTILLGLLLAVGLAGLLASFSRAGTALGVLALSLALLVGGRARALGARLAATLLIGAAAAMPLLQLGWERLLLRYAQTGHSLASAGGRAPVWADTLEIASAFAMTGSGFGTFASIYPTFRAPEVRLFYAHAHNDLLQLAAEGGLLSIALLALLLVPLVRTLVRALGGAQGPLGVGLACGLIAVLLHSLVDFDFHIPASAATAAVLAGALSGLPCLRP